MQHEKPGCDWQPKQKRYTLLQLLQCSDHHCPDSDCNLETSDHRPKLLIMVESQWHDCIAERGLQSVVWPVAPRCTFCDYFACCKGGGGNACRNAPACLLPVAISPRLELGHAYLSIRTCCAALPVCDSNVLPVCGWPRNSETACCHTCALHQGCQTCNPVCSDWQKGLSSPRH